MPPRFPSPMTFESVLPSYPPPVRRTSAFSFVRLASEEGRRVARAIGLPDVVYVYYFAEDAYGEVAHYFRPVDDLCPPRTLRGELGATVRAHMGPAEAQHD